MNRRLAVAAIVAVALAGALVLPGWNARADEAPAAGGDTAQFKNVKVLTNVTSKSEMRQIMKAQAASLGVKCTHCHVQGKFELDDKKEKQVAREMLRMTQNLNDTMFKDAKDKPRISCWTCHRGSTDPERVVPQSAFDAMDAQGAAPPAGEAPKQ